MFDHSWPKACLTTVAGPGCDVVVNECENSTAACKHGGNCTDLELGFSCNCSLGYRGDTCEIPYCSLTNCYNGGTCTTNVTEWRCDCPGFIEGLCLHFYQHGVCLHFYQHGDTNFFSGSYSYFFVSVLSCACMSYEKYHSG